mmetsp:Transcript_50601/g.101044  ORF Transcript_50601/g.101044 Transcript_50601/m.101044 type:complete len:227 (-) Transcript_50601:25-705(-)
MLDPVELLGGAGPGALGVGGGYDADVDALVDHLLKSLERAGEGLHGAVEPGLLDHLQHLLALLHREVALDLELGAALDQLLVLGVPRQPPLPERPVPVRDHHVHVDQHRLRRRRLRARRGVHARRRVGGGLLDGDGGRGLGGRHLVDELHVRLGHGGVRELLHHPLPPLLPHRHSQLLAQVQLVHRVAQRLRVLGRNQEPLFPVLDRLRQPVDVGRHQRAAERLRL